LDRDDQLLCNNMKGGMIGKLQRQVDTIITFRTMARNDLTRTTEDTERKKISKTCSEQITQ